MKRLFFLSIATLSLGFSSASFAFSTSDLIKLRCGISDECLATSIKNLNFYKSRLNLINTELQKPNGGLSIGYAADLGLRIIDQYKEVEFLLDNFHTSMSDEKAEFQSKFLKLRKALEKSRSKEAVDLIGEIGGILDDVKAELQ